MYERQERVAEQKHAEIWHAPEPVRAEDQPDSLRRPDAQGEQARPREGAAERREREGRRAQAAARAEKRGNITRERASMTVLTGRNAKRLPRSNSPTSAGVAALPTSK